MAEPKKPAAPVTRTVIIAALRSGSRPAGVGNDPARVGDERTGRTDDPSVLEDSRTSDDRPDYPPLHREPVVDDGRAGRPGQEVGGRDESRRPGIVDADVGVAAHGDRSLAREQAEPSRG